MITSRVKEKSWRRKWRENMCCFIVGDPLHVMMMSRRHHYSESKRKMETLSILSCCQSSNSIDSSSCVILSLSLTFAGSSLFYCLFLDSQALVLLSLLMCFVCLQPLDKLFCTEAILHQHFVLDLQFFVLFRSILSSTTSNDYYIMFVKVEGESYTPEEKETKTRKTINQMVGGRKQS